MPPKRTIITSPEPILAALYRQELIRLLLAREEQRTDRQWNRWSTEREWNTPPIEVSTGAIHALPETEPRIA